MLPIHIPHEQVNDNSVLLVDWLVADGSEVKPGQPIATIETSKATTQVEAPQAGYLRHAAIRGAEIPVGAVFGHIAGDIAELTSAPPPSVPGTSQPAPAPSVASVVETGQVTANDGHGSGTKEVPALQPGMARFSRRAQALIQQKGLSNELFKGMSIVRELDVLAILNATGAEQGSTAPITESPQPEIAHPSGAAGVPCRVEELSRMKRLEGRCLASAQRNTLTSLVSVIAPVAGLRAASLLQPELGGRSSAVVIYETARLLRKHPKFNAFHHDGKVHLYDQVNIGLAVDGGRGLKVPVIMDADKKGLLEIARELEGLLLDYLNDQLSVASLAGGTFTITDLSGEGVFVFQPLINQDQAAILGLGAEYSTAGSPGGYFNLILSFDHQLAEGRVAARFLTDLRERLNTYEQALRASGESAARDLLCSRCRRPAAELARLGVPLLEELRGAGERALICKSCLIGV